jgi:hypothetical protein
MKTPELRVQLTSGACLTVSEVFLCLEEPLRRSDALRLKAAEGLKGFSSGIGFWGSPGWAIGGAIGLGLIEGLVSSSVTKAALQDLKEAAKLAADAVRAGAFVPVNEIEGIDAPQPSAWRGLLRNEDGTFRAYVHDSEAFLRVNTHESGVVCVFLDKIELFIAPASAKADDDTLASSLGISFDGKQYEYAGYRYERIADAIAYARTQRAKA